MLHFNFLVIFFLASSAPRPELFPRFGRAGNQSVISLVPSVACLSVAGQGKAGQGCTDQWWCFWFALGWGFSCDWQLKSGDEGNRFRGLVQFAWPLDRTTVSTHDGVDVAKVETPLGSGGKRWKRSRRKSRVASAGVPRRGGRPGRQAQTWRDSEDLARHATQQLGKQSRTCLWPRPQELTAPCSLFRTSRWPYPCSDNLFFSV